MLDVGHKEKTERIAVASARLRATPTVVRLIKSGKVEKGDVVAAARLAGVMAAKKTPDLVPLCHPIALTSVEVQVTPRSTWVDVQATVKTTDRTGVEMEALTAVSAAALTIYDMLKSKEPGMSIEWVRLERKSGGKSGLWRREDDA